MDAHIAQSVCWEQTARNVAAGSDIRGHTILRLQNRLARKERSRQILRKKLRAAKASTPTLGDLINARARAGAARVEAEQAVERARVVLKHAHGRARIAAAREALAAAEKRRTQACEAYGAARAAEQAAS